MLVHTANKIYSQLNNIIVRYIFITYKGSAEEVKDGLGIGKYRKKTLNFPRLDQEIVRGFKCRLPLLYINQKIHTLVTSPLKIFEYMPTKNPTIFAVRWMKSSSRKCLPYIMDDSSGCIKSIKLAISDISKKNNKKADLAYQEVINNFTWEIRAQNIIKFLKIFE